jgi:hypothetical protein
VIFDEDVKTKIGKKIASSRNGAEKTGYHLVLKPIQSVIKDLNVVRRNTESTRK